MKKPWVFHKGDSDHYRTRIVKVWPFTYWSMTPRSEHAVPGCRAVWVGRASLIAGPSEGIHEGWYDDPAGTKHKLWVFRGWFGIGLSWFPRGANDVPAQDGESK